MGGARRTIVWLTPAQAGLVREVARAAELEIVGVGSPERGRAGPLAADLAGEGERGLNDLRAALASQGADLFWLLAPGEFGSGPDDALALQEAHARGAKVVTLEPMPALATDLSTRAWTEGVATRAIDVGAFVPAWAGCPREVVGSIGPLRAMALEWWSGPGEGTLGARLYGAMDLTLRLMGEPESIDAAYVSAEQGRGVHALPGESLRGLCGDLTASLRFAEGRAGSVALSSRGGRWERTLTVLGPGGRARVGDDSLQWFGPDGSAIEEPGVKTRRGKGSKRVAEPADAREGAPSGALGAFAAGLTRALSGAAAEAPEPDRVTVLAMCHAALLSARTGQGESPATIRRIVGME